MIVSSNMGAEADIIFRHQVVDVMSISTQVSRFDSVAACAETIGDAVIESSVVKFVPRIRSGSCANIGPRRSMEDEHIRIDDLSSHLGSIFNPSIPTAFYAVFDGHGGVDAAAYIKSNATSVSSSCGTTVLTALVLGRHLLVANAGDCRAVLCRKGTAVEMSHDHRPSYLPERKRVEELGGFIDDGYLNGYLSVTRALGDWDMKFPLGSASPLIAEPDVRQIVLSEDDEFLIIGCDGIWDVMSSQFAVSLVRRALRRHDNPEECAKELVNEASRLNSSDNLTAIVICFSSPARVESCPPHRRRFRNCNLSEEARNKLKSLLEGN
ncbi:hypothetical protein E1A91_A02G064400v1 [Gossypium mustelinum]|uniref:protein-serine/threonine phosphatase n=1 Tax=Gossypium mustelinum TaxID=34275 RepID=A0A5D3A7H5_GOSMU|nr:hypothetical protein E1A91_A02G064400v1 [Gossypium mustelinum]